MARISLVVVLCAAACSSARAAAPERAARPEAPSAAHANEPALRLVADTPKRATTKDYVAGGADAPLPAADTVPASNRPANNATASARAACPPEMALVERPQGRFCVDRWEAILFDPARPERRWPGNQRVPSKRHELVARSVAGERPQAYVSGAEAARACANAGKRLCELDEWVRACRGARASTYPYGERREAERCNDRPAAHGDHPVVTLFTQLAAEDVKRGVQPADPATMWDQSFMNDPRLYDMPNGVEPTGAHPGCRSEYGAFDMVGNLHEWVDDPEGTFVGGFFMDTSQNGEGCGYRTRAHDFDYHDYSTGFRCCKDAG